MTIRWTGLFSSQLSTTQPQKALKEEEDLNLGEKMACLEANPGGRSCKLATVRKWYAESVWKNPWHKPSISSDKQVILSTSHRGIKDLRNQTLPLDPPLLSCRTSVYKPGMSSEVFG